MCGRVGGVGLLLRATFGDDLLVRRAASVDRGLLAQGFLVALDAVVDVGADRARSDGLDQFGVRAVHAFVDDLLMLRCGAGAAVGGFAGDLEREIALDRVCLPLHVGRAVGQGLDGGHHRDAVGFGQRLLLAAGGCHRVVRVALALDDEEVGWATPVDSGTPVEKSTFHLGDAVTGVDGNLRCRVHRGVTIAARQRQRPGALESVGGLTRETSVVGSGDSFDVRVGQLGAHAIGTGLVQVHPCPEPRRHEIVGRVLALDLRRGVRRLGICQSFLALGDVSSAAGAGVELLGGLTQSGAFTVDRFARVVHREFGCRITLLRFVERDLSVRELRAE